MSSEYLSAGEAAQRLGVSLQTLYVYVTRKGIRSQAVPGSRAHRYWKADIDRLAGRNGSADKPVRDETALTLVTEDGLFYRGQNALELAQTATFEAVVALLWGVTEETILSVPAPIAYPGVRRVDKLLKAGSAVNRASAMFPLLEEANPKSYDLSPLGIVRTGTDIIRWLAAITLRTEPSAEPLHVFVARQLQAGAEQADLIRRLLILSADHSFETGTIVVRTMASSGVTPWRSVLGGLTVALGRRTKTDNFGAIQRFLTEVMAASDGSAPVIQRLSEGEPLPGFGSTVYLPGDPRARALLSFCGEIYAGDPAYMRLREALDAAKEIRNAEPNFALACLFAGAKLGCDSRESLFHVGRSAGWVAHVIEQRVTGEIPHERGPYSGPLPT